MAFVRVEAREPLLLAASLRRAERPVLPRYSSATGRRLWKGSATILSCLVHVGLGWLLLNRLGADNWVDRKVPATASLTVITLDGAEDAADVAQEATASPSAPATSTVPGQVDITNAARVTAVEWSVTKMRVAAMQPVPGLASLPVSGQDGGSGFDPYAGAAPRWDERPIAQASPPSGFKSFMNAIGLGALIEAALPLDEVVLEKVRQSVQAANPGTRETINLSVRISPTGMVLDAEVVGPRSEVGQQLIAGLLGKRLVRVQSVLSDARSIRLPTIQVG